MAKQEKDKVIQTGNGLEHRRTGALQDILNSEDEYRNLQDHIAIDDELEDAMLREMQKDAECNSIVNVSALLYYDVQGFSPQATAALLGITPGQVVRIRKTDSFTEARKAVMDEVLKLSRRMIDISSIKAVKTLLSCMDSGNDKIRLSAAVEILNRVGLSSTQKVEITTTAGGMQTYSDEELAEILKGSIPVEALAAEVEDVGTE